MFGPAVDEAMRRAAVASWPREMCGVVTGGAFVPLPNVADDPKAHFALPDDTWRRYAPVQAVGHGHVCDSLAAVSPGFPPDAPSAADMRSQVASAVPWAIVVTDGQTAAAPLWWGDHTLRSPLLGRPFRHGVTDCYAAIRAWYWHERQVMLPDYPRDAAWWNHGGDLYRENFRSAGFVAIGMDEAARGDVLLMAIGRTAVPNHAAIYLGGGLIYHHPTPFPSFGRKGAESLSREEPIGSRHSYLTHTLRFAG